MLAKLEIIALVAIILGAGIAAITIEKRQQVILPAFVKPVCPTGDYIEPPAKARWDI